MEKLSLKPQEEEEKPQFVQEDMYQEPSVLALASEKEEHQD
jgi:hypothetical protein